MAPPEEVELRGAVLEYLTSTADMSLITMKTIRVALEARFGCDLEASRNVLKNAMHSFIDNLVGKDEEGESNDEERNTLKRKQCTSLLRVQPMNPIPCLLQLYASLPPNISC